MLLEVAKSYIVAEGIEGNSLRHRVTQPLGTAPTTLPRPKRLSAASRTRHEASSRILTRDERGDYRNFTSLYICLSPHPLAIVPNYHTQLNDDDHGDESEHRALDCPESRHLTLTSSSYEPLGSFASPRKWCKFRIKLVIRTSLRSGAYHC
jgi:hypothetical protein